VEASDRSPRQPADRSTIDRLFFILVPVALASLATLAGLWGATFDRCERTCATPGETLFVQLGALLVAGVLIAALWLCVIAWRRPDSRSTLRRARIASGLSLLVAFAWVAIAEWISVGVST
jgi:hypothetical protein